MGFMDREKALADNVAKAEQELKEVLDTERPAEAGAQIPKDPKETPPAGDVPAVVDGVDWKERYGNLQRWIDKSLKVKHQGEIDKLTSDIKALQGQVSEMLKKASPANLPATIEEVEKLKAENPGAYAAIMKVASEVAENIVADRISSFEQDVQELKRVRKETAEEAAFVELQKRFPDIDIVALENDASFSEWIKTKSQRTQDAIFKNKTDVDAAADVLTLYRYEVLVNKKQKTEKNNNKPGSEQVNVKSGQMVIQGNPNLGFDFTESQIDEMDKKDQHWMAKNIEAIDKAAKAGRILLDISDPVGSARRMAALGVA